MRILFALLAVAACLVPVRAQQTTNRDEVQKGHQLAAIICSNCHVVGPDQTTEPILRPPAPSFESIARRSDSSSETIRSFLATTHRDINNPAGMPNPELPDFELSQVTAYILSLRKAAPASVSRKPVAAQPGSCQAEIAHLESRLSELRANGQAIGSAPESSAARLHRQPTAQSVKQAASEAEKTVETALAMARKLGFEGLDAECAAMLKKVEPSLGPR